MLYVPVKLYEALKTKLKNEKITFSASNAKIKILIQNLKINIKSNKKT